MCKCGENLWQAYPGDQPYWAYLHANGQVVVKGWWAPSRGIDCDCCHADSEKNSFVQKVLPPFWAPSHKGARVLAHNFFHPQIHTEEPYNRFEGI